jgi:hypothetical protein
MADLERSLRRVILQWDPIGVAEFAPEDEYDCMISPLLGLLKRGASAAQIGEHLRHDLEGHFGLDPAFIDVRSMANRLVAWWSTVSPG